MRATSACLLLFFLAVVGTSAYSYDDAVLEALKEVQTSMASGLELPAINDKLSRVDKMMPFLAEGGNGECCNCTKGSAKWVMDHVIAAIKTKCSETKCEKFKKMCEKAAAHPEESFGYLLGAVRPVSLGYAWCNGKGVCGKEGEETQFTLDEAVSVSQSMEALLKEADKDEDEQSIIQAVDAEDNADDEEDDGIKCHKCVKGVSKGFMWKTVGKIKKLCKTTKCPVLQKMCAAAKKHPKVAFGYLFYKLRPVEFAYGFCLGKGSCGMKAGGCNHDELVFDLMEDDKMSLDDGAEDAAIFF